MAGCWRQASRNPLQRILKKLTSDRPIRWGALFLVLLWGHLLEPKKQDTLNDMIEVLNENISEEDTPLDTETLEETN